MYKVGRFNTYLEMQKKKSSETIFKERMMAGNFPEL